MGRTATRTSAGERAVRTPKMSPGSVEERRASWERQFRSTPSSTRDGWRICCCWRSKGQAGDKRSDPFHAMRRFLPGKQTWSRRSGSTERSRPMPRISPSSMCRKRSTSSAIAAREIPRSRTRTRWRRISRGGFKVDKGMITLTGFRSRCQEWVIDLNGTYGMVIQEMNFRGTVEAGC